MIETLPVSPAKSAVTYGVLFGVIMVLEFVASYVLDIDPISNPTYGLILNVLNYLLLPVLLISLAVNNYKKINHGFISFGQCLKIGVTLCVIAGLIYALFAVVFNMIFPEYIDEIMRKYRIVMQQQSPDMPAEQMEMALEWTKKFMQPAIMIPVTVLMFAFIGLIYSLIIGAISKKDQPQSL